MSYFPFQSQGYIKPVSDWWLLLTADPEIVKYYSWLARTWGIAIEAGSRHGPHISVVKGERVKNKSLWFKWAAASRQGKAPKIKFKYSNQLRHNGYHAWLDVQAPALSEIRTQLGLKPKPYHSFHLTIGRLRLGIDHEMHELRPKNRRKKERRKALEVEVIKRK